MPQVTLGSYAKSAIYSVAGYLRSIDARTIRALLEYQSEAKVPGALCEFGVHHGRLFLMLALARRAGEKSLAIDLFEDDAGNAQDGSHRGRDRALVRNARRLGIPLTESEVLKTSSLDIHAADILAKTGDPIRFFSIDGGHDYTCVANDLKLATACLQPKGVIAVDDFFNREWPEVAYATYDFLQSQREIVPFLLTTGKLYLSHREYAEEYARAVITRVPDAQNSIVDMRGVPVTYLRDGNVKRVLDVARDRLMERVRLLRA